MISLGIWLLQDDGIAVASTLNDGLSATITIEGDVTVTYHLMAFARAKNLRSEDRSRED
jgi:hypothetical protein